MNSTATANISSMNIDRLSRIVPSIQGRGSRMVHRFDLFICIYFSRKRAHYLFAVHRKGLRKRSLFLVINMAFV